MGEGGYAKISSNFGVCPIHLIFFPFLAHEHNMLEVKLGSVNVRRRRALSTISFK